MSLLNSMLKNSNAEGMLNVRDDFRATDMRVFSRVDKDGDVCLLIFFNTNITGWARGNFSSVFEPEMTEGLSEHDLLNWGGQTSLRMVYEGKSSSVSWYFSHTDLKSIKKIPGNISLGSPDGSVLSQRIMIDYDSLTREYVEINPITE